MPSHANVQFVIALLSGSCSVALGGDYCLGVSPEKTVHTWCPRGCCGYYPDRYCCHLGVGVIVGGVFAGVGALCVLAVVVYCCLKRRDRARARLRISGQEDKAPAECPHIQVTHFLDSPDSSPPFPNAEDNHSFVDLQQNDDDTQSQAEPNPDGTRCNQPQTELNPDGTSSTKPQTELNQDGAVSAKLDKPQSEGEQIGGIELHGHSDTDQHIARLQVPGAKRSGLNTAQTRDRSSSNDSQQCTNIDAKDNQNHHQQYSSSDNNNDDMTTVMHHHEDNEDGNNSNSGQTETQQTKKAIFYIA